MRRLAMWVGVGIVLCTASRASAQSYQVHAQTQARISQVPRIDGSVDAQRTFMQQLGVSVYDATDDQKSTVNGHVSFRYFTDFGIDQGLRSEDDQGIWWNYFALDQAWAEYNPWHAMQVRAGRQFHLDALGMRDFDGAAIILKPRLGPSVRGVFEAYGGRDVQFEGGDIDPDSYDVQGVGFNSDFAKADGTWIVGGRAGVRWTEASFDFSYGRRDYDLQPTDAHDTEFAVGEERFGVAMSGVVASDVNLSSQASFNTVLDAVDNGRVQLAWRIPSAASVFSGGVEHRVPWFDSGSIWNVFGAQPRQGAFLTYQQPIESLRTTFEARSFGRVYHGDNDHWDWGSGADDEITLGGGIGHKSHLYAADYPLRWSSFVSAQTSVEHAVGGDQFLFDTGVSGRTFGLKKSTISLRALLLHATPSNWRRNDSTAITGVAKLDWPTQIGDLGFTFELSQSSDLGSNSRFYAVYELKAWP